MPPRLGLPSPAGAPTLASSQGGGAGAGGVGGWAEMGGPEAPLQGNAPPLHLRILQKVSQQIQVHETSRINVLFYLPQPQRHPV